MLDVHIARRSEIANQVRALISVRGPRTSFQKSQMDSLLREVEEIEDSIASEYERRQSAAFSAWLRQGKMLDPENKRLLSEIQTRDMIEQGLGIGTAGGPGVFVPVGYEKAVVSSMKSYSKILNLCNLVEADNRPHPYPLDNEGASIGELLGEGQQASIGDVASPSQVIIGSFRFSSKICRVSRELLQDQEVSLDSYLSRIFAVRLARIASQYLTTGTGVNQPTGFMNSATIVNAGVAVGAFQNDGASGGNSLGLADFATLESAVDPSYRANSKWFLHPASLQKLRAQVDKQGHPLYPGLQNSPDGVARIFNREVCTSPFMDQLQTGPSSPTVTRKPIALVDLSRYTCRKGRLVVHRLDELYAEMFAVGFLATMRVDGNFTDLGNCAAFLETAY
jgi:HK97 family phage major capsid protein